MSIGTRYQTAVVDVAAAPINGGAYPAAPNRYGSSSPAGAVGYLENWNPRSDGNVASHLHHQQQQQQQHSSSSSPLPAGNSLRRSAQRGNTNNSEEYPQGVALFGNNNSSANGRGRSGTAVSAGVVDTAEELETLGSIHYSLSKLYEEMNGQDFNKFISEIESFEIPAERFRPWLKNDSVRKALKDSTQQTTPRPTGTTLPPSVKSLGTGTSLNHQNNRSNNAGSSAVANPASSSAAAGSSSWDLFASRHKPRLHGGARTGNTDDMQRLLEEEGQMLAPIRSEALAPETEGRDFNCATASFISRQYEEINRRDITIEELEARNSYLVNFTRANFAALHTERMQAERHLLEKCDFLADNQEESRSIATEGVLDIEAAARTQMERLHDEVIRELSNEMVRMHIVTKATHNSSGISWIEMHEERARHNQILEADRAMHYLFSDHFTALHGYMLNLHHHNARPQNYYNGVNPYTIADDRDPTLGIDEYPPNRSGGGGNARSGVPGGYPRSPQTPRGGGGGDQKQQLQLTDKDGQGKDTSRIRQKSPRAGGGVGGGNNNNNSLPEDLPDRAGYIDGLLSRNLADKQRDLLEASEGPAKEAMSADREERSKKRDEVRKRQAAAEEAALRRKEAANKQKDLQNRRDNDISTALGNSRATPRKTQKRSSSLRSLNNTNGKSEGGDGYSQDGASSSLDGSMNNVPLSMMLARRAAAAKRTPDQIIQEADDFVDDRPQQLQHSAPHTSRSIGGSGGLTARSGGVHGGAAANGSGANVGGGSIAGGGNTSSRHGGNIGTSSGSGGDFDMLLDGGAGEHEPWASSVGRKALADLGQFPPFYGWMYKSQGVLMSWQRRYFVLTKTGKLKYTTQDPTVEGGANVRWLLLLYAEDITRVEVDMFQDSSAGVKPPVDQYHSNCFYVDAVSDHDDHDAQGRPRRFKFCCRNKSEMTRWMQTLRKATDVVYTLEEAGLVPRSPVREHFRKMFALLSPLLAGGGAMTTTAKGAGADRGVEEDDVPAYRRRVQMEDDIAALEVQQRDSEEKERRQVEEDRRLGRLSPQPSRGRSVSPPLASRSSPLHA